MGKRVQNFNLKNLETKVINLGYVGENVHTQIVIECSEVLWDYPNAVASMVVQPPRGDLYPVEVTREENNIIWEITASDVVYAGSGRVQLTFTNDGEIVKSAVGTTRISGSIEATGEAPEPLQNWIDQAEETAYQIALTAKDEVIEQIQDAAEEARESIPADYTQLSDDVTSLKSAKAEIDGYYQDMTVGDAEQLVSSQFVEDSVPYKFRTSGGSADVGNREYVDKIVGGTIAWNQLVRNGNFANGSTNWTVSGATATAENNVLTIVADRANPYVAQVVPFVDSHVYLMKVEAKQDEAGQLLLTSQARLTTSSSTVVGQWVTLASVSKASAPASSSYVLFDPHSKAEGNKLYLRNFQVYDLTQMFGSTIADYIAGIESATNGAGVAWFRKLFPDDYYAYNAGELISVSGLQSHDTVGFNQWDEEWVNGFFNDSGAYVARSDIVGAKNAIPVLPNTVYSTNMSQMSFVTFWRSAVTTVNAPSSEFIGRTQMMNRTFTTPSDCHYIFFNLPANYGNTYKNDIFINLSWSGTRNGEYKPYEKHSYPLDSSLTLRGVPKWADGKLYFDGDEYLPEGKVNRRFGIVDLGTLNWSNYNLEKHYFRNSNNPVSFKKNISNVICSKYPYIGGAGTSATTLRDKSLYIDWNNDGMLLICDTAYNNSAEFKAAMSGVMLVYELATPTTETAQPYHSTQWVSDWGTEEFVSTGIVPVGHETRYPANLRDKLQHLPDAASGNGSYLITQTDGQMVLTPFPAPPSTAGNYVLKATVVNGVATYTWEVAT